MCRQIYLVKCKRDACILLRHLDPSSFPDLPLSFSCSRLIGEVHKNGSHTGQHSGHRLDTCRRTVSPASNAPADLPRSLETEIGLGMLLWHGRSGFFGSYSDLTGAVTSLVAQDADDEVRQQKVARLVALAKRDFDQQPSTSTGITRSASSDGGDVGETLIDVLWAVDQSIDAGSEGQEAATKARSNLAQIVQQLHASDAYTADFLRQRLDYPLLEAAGLLSSATVQQLTRQEPRIKTALLYKQQKFNLLREETEGYSKLEIELLANMGPPHEARTARPAEPMTNVRKRALKTVENIKGLIGYFDLDPVRTLDIILDVFADNVLYHHVFFRELLKASPWSPKGELASLNCHQPESLLPDGSMGSSKRGSGVCAQILGFKFAWYNVCPHCLLSSFRCSIIRTDCRRLLRASLGKAVPVSCHSDLGRLCRSGQSLAPCE